MKWSKYSWRNYPVSQQPGWCDYKDYTEIINKLNKLPSLVFSGETRKLISILNTNSFLLQVGNCAESFDDCNGPKIHDFLRIFLQMASIIEYNSNIKVAKVGRIAGQYAKPRSSDYEKINEKFLPSYRGDIVNEIYPTFEARLPRPDRMLEGYYRSAATLNLIRAFIQGGYSDLENLNDWEEHFFINEISKNVKYTSFINSISNSLKTIRENDYQNDQIYISHEALLLDYEEAFTRLDTTFGGYYDTNAHFLWVGDRTRQLSSAHIEYISGIGNPVGIKVGPNYDIEELMMVVKKVNPKNIYGKLSLICRMGHENIKTKLQPIIERIKKDKLNVIWVCDPMHGNTFIYNDIKVRSVDDIISEIKTFFSTCFENKIKPGGVHLEITEENVTECIGGINGLELKDISENYTSKVDPRLNAAQALEIAFIISEQLNSDPNRQLYEHSI